MESLFGYRSTFLGWSLVLLSDAPCSWSPKHQHMVKPGTCNTWGTWQRICVSTWSCVSSGTAEVCFFLLNTSGLVRLDFLHIASKQLVQHKSFATRRQHYYTHTQARTLTSLHSICPPFKQISDQQQAEGAGQNSVKVRSFSVDTTFTVLQVGPGDVPWQPQTLPPQPLSNCLQHAARKCDTMKRQFYKHNGIHTFYYHYYYLFRAYEVVTS